MFIASWKFPPSTRSDQKLEFGRILTLILWPINNDKLDALFCSRGRQRSLSMHTHVRPRGVLLQPFDFKLAFEDPGALIACLH